MWLTNVIENIVGLILKALDSIAQSYPLLILPILLVVFYYIYLK